MQQAASMTITLWDQQWHVVALGLCAFAALIKGFVMQYTLQCKPFATCWESTSYVLHCGCSCMVNGRLAVYLLLLLAILAWSDQTRGNQSLTHLPQQLHIATTPNNVVASGEHYKTIFVC